MIIPNKYENISQNILELGKDLLTLLSRRKNIYDLYKELIIHRNENYEVPFSKYLIALDFLYALGKIDIEDENVVRLK